MRLVICRSRRLGAAPLSVRVLKGSRVKLGLKTPPNLLSRYYRFSSVRSLRLIPVRGLSRSLWMPATIRVNRCMRNELFHMPDGIMDGLTRLIPLAKIDPDPVVTREMFLSLPDTMNRLPSSVWMRGLEKGILSHQMFHWVLIGKEGSSRALTIRQRHRHRTEWPLRTKG